MRKKRENKDSKISKDRIVFLINIVIRVDQYYETSPFREVR